MDMQNIPIKVIVRRIVNVQNPSEAFAFEAENERIVFINPGTLIRDVCREIMSKIGLDHLINNSQAYIQFPGPRYFTFESFFPNLDVNIGIVKSLFGEALVVRISSVGDTKDFSDLDMKKSVCTNMLQLLLKKDPSVRQYIENPLVLDIINSLNATSDIKIPYQTIFNVNRGLEEELISTNLNEIRPNSYFKNSEQPPTPSSLTGDLNQQEGLKTQKPKEELLPDNGSFIKTILQNISPHQGFMKSILTPPSRQHYYSRCRVSFDPTKETPILEKWYEENKTPTSFQLQQYANQLNEMSNRTPNARITSHNVKIWFKNRRAKENRVSRLLEKKK
uniref:Homeobox domain-containing protein n=1 Tax=Strongyloides papillosus TaxID=174720 RepID=A0A0N5B4P2_STREA